MPKGHPNQHQQNNQNPAQGQAQHDDGNDAQGQQDNQADPNQPPNNQGQQNNQADLNQLPNNQGQQGNQQRMTLLQRVQNNIVLSQNNLTNQNQIFLGIAENLASLDRKVDNILLEIRRSNNIYSGRPSSLARKYIFDHLNSLNWTQITSLFAELIIRYNNQNRERTIPLINRDEKRKKSLLLHKLDIYWDQLEPFINDATIFDIRNSLHLNSDDSDDPDPI
ncbi:hypothetical protein M9Y10_021229 [Tritrichomonas musculus]|uniref:Uncharacterized protein n=1 Tax=Tritrichomonas musculus TaxID=1915356 RepID=A0ABR2HDF6_9EUKA